MCTGGVVPPTKVLCVELYPGSRSAEWGEESRDGGKAPHRRVVGSASSRRSSKDLCSTCFRTYSHEMKLESICPSVHLSFLPPSPFLPPPLPSSSLPFPPPPSALVSAVSQALCLGAGTQNASGFVSVLRSLGPENPEGTADRLGLSTYLLPAGIWPRAPGV